VNAAAASESDSLLIRVLDASPYPAIWLRVVSTSTATGAKRVQFLRANDVLRNRRNLSCQRVNSGDTNMRTFVPNAIASLALLAAAFLMVTPTTWAGNDDESVKTNSGSSTKPGRQLDDGDSVKTSRDSQTRPGRQADDGDSVKTSDESYKRPGRRVDDNN
jgi:hypothetical protein